jgi:hypothetical protein
MQTGAGWEGLGAEYQPGTVEGLGLLAGDPYTGYQPMDTGLLGAAPSFMGNPSGFAPFTFEGGLEGSTDAATTNTNSGTWSPTWQWHDAGSGLAWGYFGQAGEWNPGAGQPGFEV